MSQFKVTADPLRFFHACKEGDLTTAKTILQQTDYYSIGALTNFETTDDATRETPLMAASLRGYKEIVELLLTNNAVIDQPDYYGSTSLQYATSDGQSNVVEVLLKYGANVNGDSKKRRQQQNQQQNHHQQQTYGTPLHCAAWEGYYDIAKTLVEHGAEINRSNFNFLNSTPLMAASLRGHFQVSEYLLKHGAETEFEDEIGMTALGLACIKGHVMTATSLIQHGADVNHVGKLFTPLVASIQNGASSEILNLLLTNGANPNQIDPKSKLTPLVLAVKKQNISFVQLLVDHGANVNWFSKDGETAWLVAEEKGCKDISELLTSRINVNYIGINGSTLLHCLATINTVGDAKEQHCDPKKCGCQPVLDRAKRLLQHGADPDIADVHGRTPLHLAAMHDNLQLIKLLISSGGANFHRLDLATRSTPLEIAATRESFNSVYYLLILGAFL